MATALLMTILIDGGWVTLRELEGTATVWNPPMEERLRRAHRGTPPSGWAGNATHPPISPMLNSSFFLWMGEGCHLSGGATGRAAAESQAAGLVQQVAGLVQQVAALTPHVAMLRGQTVRMQQCIDTAYFRLHHNLHLSARETLEIELSQDRYPSREWVGKNSVPPVFTPLNFEQNYVSNKASKFQTPDFKPKLTFSFSFVFGEGLVG